MKLTRASSYALHAAAYMAGQRKGLPTPSHIIAQKRGIPERFLLKVLKPLVSAGLLYSVKGPHGGYRLARTAKEITMLDVIEAVEGPIRGLASFHAEGGNNALDRHLDDVCSEVAEKMRAQLKAVKLSTMANL